MKRGNVFTHLCRELMNIYNHFKDNLYVFAEIPQ